MYPSDPHLLSVRDYIMQQARSSGMVNEGQMLNRMVTRKPEAEASESGLVLPGQETSGGESGKSKLWLPGFNGCWPIKRPLGNSSGLIFADYLLLRGSVPPWFAPPQS